MNRDVRLVTGNKKFTVPQKMKLGMKIYFCAWNTIEPIIQILVHSIFDRIIQTILIYIDFNRI